MTCIIGLESDGQVYMGGDSAGVAGMSVSVRADEKVFTTGPFIMGFTTSFRMGQLLRYKFEPPAQPNGVDDMRFMVVNFIDAVRKCFFDNGYGKKEDNRGGTFLVGYKGRLYTVHDDFQVGKPSEGYDAVGSGTDLALGAMAVSAGVHPMDRIYNALDAATRFNAGVLPPYTILSAS